MSLNGESGAATARSPSSKSTPSRHQHPLLHPDILPLILSHADDRTLARLMRVSRHVLTHVVELRWPKITLVAPAERRRAGMGGARNRTDLPDQPHWFSYNMQLLLLRYARAVIISPHPAYTCPPPLVKSEQHPLARTLQIQKLGLCRSDHLPSTSTASGGTSSGDGHRRPCELCRLFSPTTLRIDQVNQHPLIPFPYGLSFAPSLKRIVLFIDPNAPTSAGLSGTAYLHTSIPDHVVDIAFVLTRSPGNQAASYPGRVPSTDLLPLCTGICAWLIAGQAVEGREWSIIGAERFGKQWAYGQEGSKPLTRDAAVRKCLEDTISEQDGTAATTVMSRVHLTPLENYLVRPQARSELAKEEIGMLMFLEKARVAKRRKAMHGQDGQDGE